MSDIKLKRKLENDKGLEAQITPRPPKPVTHSLSARATSIDTMITATLSILDEQIQKLQLRSKASSLMEEDVNNLKIYIGALTSLSKEQREIDKNDDLSSLTDEELVELANIELSKRAKT